MYIRIPFSADVVLWTEWHKSIPTESQSRHIGFVDMYVLLLPNMAVKMPGLPVRRHSIRKSFPREHLCRYAHD